MRMIRILINRLRSPQRGSEDWGCLIRKILDVVIISFNYAIYRVYGERRVNAAQTQAGRHSGTRKIFERKKGREETYKTPFPGSAGEEALNRASEVSGG
ncbi:hypothetical protein C3D72_14505 [Cronobacter sakazakii]|nr:hypothetical protein C3D72_14505 [Cronobacter sakazakii]